MSKGTLFIVSAPSGAGKTSLVKALALSVEKLVVSVSHTTRQKRPDEVDGVNYHFVDEAAFQKMVSQGVFIEHARVFDNYYGTSQRHMEQQLLEGKDVILEIDWQGARQVRQQVDNSISIFVLPPSRHALEKRLKSRGQDSHEIIQRRMQDAISDMTHYIEFEYLVVNDDFDKARDELESIITGEGLKQARENTQLEGLLAELLAEP